MELQEEQLQKLEQYLTGTMNAAAKEAFQVEIETTPQLQEFIRVYQETNTLEDDTNWNVTSENPKRLKEILSILQDKNTQEFSEKIKAQRREMIEPLVLERKRWLRPLVYAAIAACLAILAYVNIPGNDNLATLYANYSTWEELPSIRVKGTNSEAQKLAVEKAFQEKDFSNTITFSNQIIDNSLKIEASVLLYKGAAQLELNDFDGALNTYTILLNSDSIDNHKGYWYTALTHLKKGDRTMTIKALKEVIKTPYNYKYRDAKALLDILD